MKKGIEIKNIVLRRLERIDVGLVSIIIENIRLDIAAGFDDEHNEVHLEGKDSSAPAADGFSCGGLATGSSCVGCSSA
jgi:hypothetical protein